MTINQDTGYSVLDALRAANFPDNSLYLAFAQGAYESTGFTSPLFRAVNNASGITFTGSDDQIATGAYDSGRKQPDGDRNYAGYDDVYAWARDFYRILNFDFALGAPADAIDPADFVTRLKANRYFTDSYDRYYNNFLTYYNQVLEQFPPEPADTRMYTMASGAGGTSGTGTPGAKAAFLKEWEWLIIFGAIILVALLSYVIYTYGNMKKSVRLAVLLLLLYAGSASGQCTGCQGGLTPYPIPNTASYGVNQWTYWSPQWSILDSLFLGPGAKVTIVGTDTGSSCQCSYLQNIDSTNGQIDSLSIEINSKLNAVNIKAGIIADNTGLIAISNTYLRGIDSTNKHIDSATRKTAENTLNTVVNVSDGLFDPVTRDPLLYSTQDGLPWLDIINRTLSGVIVNLGVTNVTVQSIAFNDTYSVPLHSIITGGLVGSAALTIADVTGLTNTEKGFILQIMPSQVQMQAFYNLATAHTVTCANASGCVFFVSALH